MIARRPALACVGSGRWPDPAGPCGSPAPADRSRPHGDVDVSISVVVPARDEAARIGPLLEAIVGAPGVTEVIVVDDESADATAGLAAGAGASVVTGRPLPAGWVGKAWALQQGLDAAVGDWVVTLDADTRPDPDAAEGPRRALRGTRSRSRHGGGGLRVPDGAAAVAAPGAADDAVWCGPRRSASGRSIVGSATVSAWRSVARRSSPPVGSVRSPTTRSRTSRSCARWPTAGFAVGFLDGSSLLLTCGCTNPHLKLGGGGGGPCRCPASIRGGGAPATSPRWWSSRSCRCFGSSPAAPTSSTRAARHPTRHAGRHPSRLRAARRRLLAVTAGGRSGSCHARQRLAPSPTALARPHVLSRRGSKSLQAV